MPGLLELGFGLLLPGLLCALLLFVVRGRSEAARARASGPTFGLPWFSAYVAWAGIPEQPFTADRVPALAWLAWIVLLGSLSSLARGTGCSARILDAIRRPVLSAALAALSLHGLGGRNGSWIAFAAICLVWILADRWLARSPGPRALLPLLITAIGTSVASLFAHSALIAGLAGALAACLGAGLLVSLLVASRLVERGASAVILLVLGGLVVDAFFFADLPLASAVLLAGSALAPGIVGKRARDGSSAADSWRLALLGGLLALLPAACAIWIAWTPVGAGG